jgi:3-methylcrotonyl-CoA carboxylase alpha subunit
LKVAAGEKLPLRQEQIRADGHAVEARICAEDPAQEFRPSAGRIERMSFRAAAGEGARIDAGFEAGDTVSSYYDNLIAKVVALGADRAGAVSALAEGLAASSVIGPATNVGFVVRCLHQADFASGAVHTGLIAEHLEALVSRDALRRRAAAVFVQTLAGDGATPDDPWSAHDGWRLNGAPSRTVAVEADGETIEIALSEAAADMEAQVFAIAGETFVCIGGDSFSFARAGARSQGLEAAAGDVVLAPLPGKIVAVHAKAGAAVKRGDPVATIEAMKMEHVVKAPRDGTIG